MERREAFIHREGGEKSKGGRTGSLLFIKNNKYKNKRKSSSSLKSTLKEKNNKI
jgi:hypothetical protein